MENLDCVCAIPEDEYEAEATGYRLYYYSFMRPSFRDFCFDDTTEYHVEVIDTWDMTVKDIGVFKGHFRIPLPGKQYMSIRLWKEHQ